MGCNDSEQTSTSSSQSIVPKMEGQERNVVNRLQELGMSQADALNFVMQQSRQDPRLIGLQDSDKALLDQAFGGAETSLQRQANLMSQDMAGTRGLNRSDTPVSEAVLREMLPQFANLNAAKASQSLGLGLNLAQLRQQNMQNLLSGAQAMPGTLGGLATRFQNERFANAKTLGSSTQSYSPGLMDQIGTGLDLGTKAVKLGGSVGSMFAGGAPPA